MQSHAVLWLNRSWDCVLVAQPGNFSDKLFLNSLWIIWTIGNSSFYACTKRSLHRRWKSKNTWKIPNITSFIIDYNLNQIFFPSIYLWDVHDFLSCIPIEFLWCCQTKNEIIIRELHIFLSFCEDELYFALFSFGCRLI